MARDELEECNDPKEMYITQGGIRMLRKIIDWDAELKDDIQKKVMMEEQESNGRDTDID